MLLQLFRFLDHNQLSGNINKFMEKNMDKYYILYKQNSEMIYNYCYCLYYLFYDRHDK